jgi:glycine betaine/proline transport system substrate-binding protein
MKRKLTTLVAAGAVAALALTGCASGDGGGDGDGDNKDITIGVFQGWDEGIAVSELWKAILEDKGYNVKMEAAEAGTVFVGLSEGDYDLTMDVWLPYTHKSYLKKYGDDVSKLTEWNDEAKLTIAVNEDADIDSLTELNDKADMFNDQLIGIEPGAGLTEATEDEVIPKYGLDDIDFKTSSTPAMLAELKSATEAGDDIAVTLWRPHWAYDAFDIKDLKDPKGALGEAEGIYAYGKKDLADSHPEVNDWMKNFKMDSDLLFSLENEMFNKADTDDYGPIVKKWIKDNQDWVDSLTEDSDDSDS